MNTNLLKKTEDCTLHSSEEQKINDFIIKTITPTAEKLSDHSQHISDHSKELSEELMEMIQLEKELKIKEMLASNKKVELLNFERRIKEQNTMKIDLHNLLECYLIILKSNQELLNRRIQDLKMKETYLSQKEFIFNKIFATDTICTEKMKGMDGYAETVTSLNIVSYHGFSIEGYCTKISKPSFQSSAPDIGECVKEESEINFGNKIIPDNNDLKETIDKHKMLVVYHAENLYLQPRGKNTQVKDNRRKIKTNHNLSFPKLEKFLTPKDNQINEIISTEKRITDKPKMDHHPNLIQNMKKSNIIQKNRTSLSPWKKEKLKTEDNPPIENSKKSIGQNKHQTIACTGTGTGTGTSTGLLSRTSSSCGERANVSLEKREENKKNQEKDSVKGIRKEKKSTRGSSLNQSSKKVKKNLAIQFNNDEDHKEDPRTKIEVDRNIHNKKNKPTSTKPRIRGNSHNLEDHKKKLNAPKESHQQKKESLKDLHVDQLRKECSQYIDNIFKVAEENYHKFFDVLQDEDNSKRIVADPREKELTFDNPTIPPTKISQEEDEEYNKLDHSSLAHLSNLFVSSILDKDTVTNFVSNLLDTNYIQENEFDTQLKCHEFVTSLLSTAERNCMVYGQEKEIEAQMNEEERKRKMIQVNNDFQPLPVRRPTKRKSKKVHTGKEESSLPKYSFTSSIFERKKSLTSDQTQICPAVSENRSYSVILDSNKEILKSLSLLQSKSLKDPSGIKEEPIQDRMENRKRYSKERNDSNDIMHSKEDELVKEEDSEDDKIATDMAKYQETLTKLKEMADETKKIECNMKQFAHKVQNMVQTSGK